MIEARGISKAYGPRTVLRSASLSVAPGRCVVLTGENGSGKTTLLHVLAGLRRPDSGTVAWKGEVLTGAGAGSWRGARAAWGFLPQRLDFPPGATVDRLARFHCRLRGAPAHRALSWLDRVGLGDHMTQPVATLSGGMQQRLGVALTLFHEPELVVMDEPSGNLDPEWRRALVDWMTEAAEGGASVLVTSQFQEPWNGRMAFVRCRDGEIVSEDDPLPGEPGGAVREPCR